MGSYSFKLPDIGEGIAEAEIVAWHVKVGDIVEEDAPLADMMTDKATIEMTAPVAGKIVRIAGEVGDMVATGSVLAEFEVEGDAMAEEAAVEAAPNEAAQVVKPDPDILPGTGASSRRPPCVSARRISASISPR